MGLTGIENDTATPTGRLEARFVVVLSLLGVLVPTTGGFLLAAGVVSLSSSAGLRTLGFTLLAGYLAQLLARVPAIASGARMGQSGRWRFRSAITASRWPPALVWGVVFTALFVFVAEIVVIVAR
ncbi:MAG: hypothetical protein ACHQNA_07755 [Acidimicrobiales bacterium]